MELLCYKEEIWILNHRIQITQKTSEESNCRWNLGPVRCLQTMDKGMKALSRLCSHFPIFFLINPYLIGTCTTKSGLKRNALTVIKCYPDLLLVINSSIFLIWFVKTWLAAHCITSLVCYLFGGGFYCIINIPSGFQPMMSHLTILIFIKLGSIYHDIITKMMSSLIWCLFAILSFQQMVACSVIYPYAYFSFPQQIFSVK